jgi:CheY-like chemotaxis protein
MILALLEDDRHAVQVIESLMHSGHEVTTFNCSVDARQALFRENFDIVISDVHLENGSSVYHFLRWVKKESPARHTPFILFSCNPTATAKHVEDGVRTAARMLGATKFIRMDTFDAANFCAQIDDLLDDDQIAIKGRLDLSLVESDPA